MRLTSNNINRILEKGSKRERVLLYLNYKNEIYRSVRIFSDYEHANLSSLRFKLDADLYNDYSGLSKFISSIFFYINSQIIDLSLEFSIHKSNNSLLDIIQEKNNKIDLLQDQMMHFLKKTQVLESKIPKEIKVECDKLMLTESARSTIRLTEYFEREDRNKNKQKEQYDSIVDNTNFFEKELITKIKHIKNYIVACEIIKDIKKLDINLYRDQLLDIKAKIIRMLDESPRKKTYESVKVDAKEIKELMDTLFKYKNFKYSDYVKKQK